MIGARTWGKILGAAIDKVAREGFPHMAHDKDDYERMMRSRTDIVTLSPDEYEVTDIKDPRVKGDI